MEESFLLPMEDIMAIEVRMGDKTAFDILIKSFAYNQGEDVHKNIKVIADKIIFFLELEGKAQKSFSHYFVEKNIPIQINFKSLKCEQILGVIEQWLSLHSESSTILEKLYSNNHRNILFKRILFSQKQIIDDYFNTLSNNGMLKAVDLYQLLVDIISVYYLYEYNNDNQTFFQKINSFNTFLEVVKRFLHSQKRISSGATKQNFQLVRRFQFERLIEYWEEQNHELILLSDRRKNSYEIGVQTALINMKDEQTQTIRQKITLSQLIKNTLVTLNKMTAENQNYEELQAIERIYSCLKKQKIQIMMITDEEEERLSQKTQRTQRISPRSRQRQQKQKFVKKSDSFMTPMPQRISINEVFAHQQKKKQIKKQKKPDKSYQQFAISYPKSQSPSRRVHTDALSIIYNLYSSLDGLNITSLQKCLCEIGVIQKGQTELILDLLRKKIITNSDHISLSQFRQIFSNIMQHDKDLTFQVLEEFYKARLASRISVVASPRPLSKLILTNYSDKKLNNQLNEIRKYSNRKKY